MKGKKKRFEGLEIDTSTNDFFISYEVYTKARAIYYEIIGNEIYIKLK